MLSENDCIIYDKYNDGLVPEFLIDVLREKNGSDPIADHRKADRGELAGGLLFFIGIIALMVSLLMPFFLKIGTCYISVVVLALLSIVIGFKLNLKSRKLPEDYISLGKIWELFNEFSIPFTEEIGRLSRGEFREYIEAALKGKGIVVEREDSFSKIKVKREFTCMHTIALFFDLCHPTHDRYFPTVKKP